jgi:hypothetical protein
MPSFLHCPVCKSAGRSKQFEETDVGTFWLCDTCGLQFIDPIPSGVPVFVDFADAGRELFAQLDGGAVLAALLTPSETFAFRWIAKNLDLGEPVLEICCEVGRFMEAARKIGRRAYGVDPEIGHIELLQRRNFGVAQGLIEAVSGAWPIAKAVVILESLVRFPDPVGLLRSVRERFPDAPLIVTVPSPKRSLKAPGFDRRSDYPPHHLTRWSRKSLKIALENAGYSACITTTFINANSLEVPGLVRTGVRIAYRLIGEAEYSYAGVGVPRR